MAASAKSDPLSGIGRGPSAPSVLIWVVSESWLQLIPNRPLPHRASQGARTHAPTISIPNPGSEGQLIHKLWSAWGRVSDCQKEKTGEFCCLRHARHEPMNR